jgi:hypothetical protein
MLPLADVIFPAFYFAYVARVLYPIVAVAGLVAEIAIFRRFYKTETLGRLSALIIAANVVSSCLGMALASVLPSGLNPTYVRSGSGEAHAENWNRLASLSWCVAFVVSIVAEYLVLSGLTWRRRLPRLGRVVVIANVASYVVLIAVFWLSVYAAAHRW